MATKTVTGSLIVGALAFAAVVGKSTPPATQPGAETNIHRVETHSKACDPDQGNALQCGVDSFYAHGSSTYPHFQLSAAEAARTRFVIATLPDPVHTDLALLFDRFVESISQGAQEAGYTFDHAVLPWSVPQEPSQETKSSEAATAQSKDSRRRQLEREDSPGLLVFRNSAGPRGIGPDLMVLLVGETPTAGINKEQFQRAVDIVRDPTAADRPVQSVEIRNSIDIIGPTFSGSFFSLRFLLDQYKCANVSTPGSCFRIRTGTAMSHPAIEAFRANSPDTDLVTFKDSDKYEIDSFVQYVTDRGYDKTEVVLISEDETTLGALNPEEKPSASQEPDILRIYFPREISQLRAAYQGDPALSETPEDTSVPHSRLKLDLNSNGSNDDSVPSYAGKQTALSQEAVLMGIITVLRVHPHHFVLLRATDPKDLIFLTRFFRTNFPQDRIVTMTADQLLPRDINDTVFRGVLSLTNYPLLPRQLTEFDPGRPHRVFASTECAALFNATLSLLLEAPGQPNLHTLPAAKYAEYTPLILGSEQPRGEDRKPGLWLTVLGDDGYWPLALLSPPKDTKSDLRPCPDCDTPESLALKASEFNLLIILSLAVTSLGFIYLCWKGGFQSALHQQFALITDESRGILIGGAALILVGMLALMGSPFSKDHYWPLLVILGSIALLIISTTLNLWVRGQKRAGVLIAVCCVLLCSPLAWSVQPDHSPEQSILLYRMAWIQSGVSPILPVLLIGAGLLSWIWFMLKSRSLFDQRRPWLPRGIPQLPGDDDHNGTEYTRLFPFNSAFAGIAAFVIAEVVIYRFHPLSLEGKHFDYFYLMLLILGVLLIANSIMSAWKSWSKCRALLLHLNRTPLRWAFRRIHGFSWKPLWGIAGGDLMTTYKPLSRCLEGLAHLQASLKDNQQGKYLGHRNTLVRSDIAFLRSLIASPMPNRPAQARLRHDGVVNRMCSLQRNLALMCSLIYIAVLQKHWESDVRLVAAKDHAVSGNEDDANAADETPSEEKIKPVIVGHVDQKVLLAEEFLSLAYINFIHRVLIRIRCLILAATCTFMLLLFSAKAYPFEPKAAIDGFFILLFVAMAVVVYMIFAQMHRDSILSHLTKKTPGELGADFWIRILGFGVVPIFGLVSTQVPGLNRVFFQWLKPMIDALHK